MVEAEAALQQVAEAAALMPARKRWTLLAVILGSGIVFLDTSVVNLALPRIGEELSSDLFGTLEAQSYVANGYFVGTINRVGIEPLGDDEPGAGSLEVFGRLADGVSRENAARGKYTLLRMTKRVVRADARARSGTRGGSSSTS